MERLLTLFVLLSISIGSSQAALHDRGGGLIYDDVLNITWLQDANYAYTSGYAADNARDNGANATDNIFANGRMGWDAANTWANNLVYGGFDDWRLTTLVDTGTPGCNFGHSGTDCGYNVKTTQANPDSSIAVYNEIASLWYDTLGNNGLYDTNGIRRTFSWEWGLENTGADGVDFLNLFESSYWSGTEYAPDTNQAWFFKTAYGEQYYRDKSNEFYAWAVRDGDVPAVPIPAAVWLFGSGLVGLIGFSKRKKTA